MANWNFPGNQDGQIKGIADAGIENFNGSELTSLARENCQNSLDAARDENSTVRVDFDLHLTKTSAIPGFADYQQMITGCSNFWAQSKSEKAKAFLKKTVDVLNRNSCYVLRISDYNTTGLSDPYNKTGVFSFDGWNSLIKIDGGANKGDDKAGAFGIGKSAPFSNSYYRLVFYRTQNQQNERAAQGISRLLSYPVSKPQPMMTTGIGYYGNPEGNDPVEMIPELDALNQRTETGTDVFIYGFKSAADDWEKDVKIALLENFLMSFYYGKLEVNITNNKSAAQIDREHLGYYIQTMYAGAPSKMKGTYGNYLALTRETGVHTFSKDFHGLGTLELRILVDPNEKLDRKVLVVRKAGMKLFRLGNISKLIPFTGILELKGTSLNSFFRQMETVAHDNWEPGRHPSPKLAKEYYEEIKNWIRDIVSKLAEESVDEEVVLEGLGGVLQEEPQTAKAGDSDQKREGLNDHLGELKITAHAPGIPGRGFFYGSGDDGYQPAPPVKGNVGKTGEPSKRTLVGKRERKKTEAHKGTPDPAGKDIVGTRKAGGSSSCPMRNVRIIKQAQGSYTTVFEIPHDVRNGRMELVTIGENGKSNLLRIDAAQPVSGCDSTAAAGTYVEVRNLKAGGKVKINVRLTANHDYAMEINLYENN